MTYNLNLNLFNLKLTNAQKKHINYFKSQFFKINAKNKNLINIEVIFKKISLPKEIKLLEEDFQFDKNNNSYILDTQKNVAKINFTKLSANNLTCEVDSNFDLYYLYAYILEPLLIIFGAKKRISFVHSSAIEKEGESTLFPAWRHTGKTHLVLNKTVNEDYSFMGDDFTLIYNKTLYLYPKKINLFSYNLKGFPKLYEFISPGLKNRLKIMTWFKNSLEKLSYIFSGSMSKVLYRVSQLAEVATNFKASPTDLGIKFSEKSSLNKTVLLQRANYLLDSHLNNSNDISYKLTSTILFEIQDFMNLYQKSCYVAGKALNKDIQNFKNNYMKNCETNFKKITLKLVKPE